MPQTVAPSQSKRPRWTDDEDLKILDRLAEDISAKELAGELTGEIERDGKVIEARIYKLRADAATKKSVPKPVRKARVAKPKATKPKHAHAIAEPAVVEGGGAGFLEALRREVARLHLRAA